MVHALSRPWEWTNSSMRGKHSWCGSRSLEEVHQIPNVLQLPFPRLCLKASSTSFRNTLFETPHPPMTAVNTQSSRFSGSHTHGRQRVIAGQLIGLPLMPDSLPLSIPTVPTWLCTSSCPRRWILCNHFLRQPHYIKLSVRKYLLLPDRAGQQLCVCVSWGGGKQAISHHINGICQYFYERLTGRRVL